VRAIIVCAANHTRLTGRVQADPAARPFTASKLLGDLVDLVGIEPTTSSMPWKRAPSCATGPHGSEPYARLARRKKHDALRGSPRSFAAQKPIAQDDKGRISLILAQLSRCVKLI
jgi:hypothetical protein